jgi:dihydrofolate reductase
MEKIIIAAVAENNVIGKDGEIPWHIPEDLQHFKKKTTGNTVVMGRKTFQSLPESFKPLPNRQNIVLTNSNFEPKNESVVLANSLNDAWQKAKNEKVFIIGGERVYKQTMKEADKIILTEIEKRYDGDTYFPKFSKDDWTKKEKDQRDGFKFVEYTRNNQN